MLFFQSLKQIYILERWVLVFLQKKRKILFRVNDNNNRVVIICFLIN